MAISGFSVTLSLDNIVDKVSIHLPLCKGGLRGIYLIKSPLTPLFQRGGLDSYVDIGGGCGFFAKALQNRIHQKVRDLDSDRQSIDFCKQEGIEATCGDALNPTIVGDENIVCFNLILHSLGWQIGT